MSDAVGRGPNYNWEHEARHYREEADDLRKLLRLVERSGEKASLENAALRADKDALNANRVQLESDCELYNRNWKAAMEENAALRAALERGRKQLEHINNYWLDTLSSDVISADGVDQVKDAIEHAITELNTSPRGRG